MLIYVSLGCLKWRRQAGVYPGRVGGGGRGCLHSGKTSRGFPLRALAFLGGEASRPPPFRRTGGHPSRRNTSKKTPWSRGFAPVQRCGSQRCESTEAGEGARRRSRASLSAPRGLQGDGGVCSESKRREGGDAGGSAGSVCLCTGLFCLPGRA